VFLRKILGLGSHKILKERQLVISHFKMENPLGKMPKLSRETQMLFNIFLTSKKRQQHYYSSNEQSQENFLRPMTKDGFRDKLKIIQN